MPGIKVATLLLLLSICPSAAQQISTPPANKIALSGERVRIGYAYALIPDCSSAGQVKSRLLEHPKNGVVETIAEKGFSAYAKDDQRYKCNEKQSDIEAYYYKSREDFRGKDKVVIEVFYPNGAYRKLLINIDVR